LDSQPAIEVTGTVPDMRPYLQKATVAVVPITYGAGVQNKVLEAMACETPVVADKAVTGSIQAEIGQDLLIASDNQAYAEQIVNLLEDANLRQKIGSSGREYVLKHHHWPAIAAQLEEVYMQAIERQASL
jgi:glycosyltransferase involved in cell wall biosynthesis